MSTKKWAALATSFLGVIVAGTFVWVQLFAPVNRLHACAGGSAVGGSIGGPFKLLTHTGQQVTQADIITEPTLIYFGYTFCPDFCPFDVIRNAQAIDLLQEETDHKAKVVFITIDPARDTMEELDDYVHNMHPDLIALTGTEAQIAQAARAYKVYYKKQPSDDSDFYLVDHSTFSYLMLPDQGFVNFFRSDLSAEDMAKQVACYIEAA